MSGHQERYTIDTDKQLELEMPSILNGTDKLLKGGKVVVSSTKTTVKFKGQIIKWPHHIKCGICGVERQDDFDRAHAGIIKRFRTGMGISLLSCIF